MPKERDLLPGQKQMFADIASKEKERKAGGGGGGNTPGGPTMRPPMTRANTVGLGSVPATPSRHSAPAGGWDDSDDVVI